MPLLELKEKNSCSGLEQKKSCKATRLTGTCSKKLRLPHFLTFAIITYNIDCIFGSVKAAAGDMC